MGAKMRQSRADREYILGALPSGVRRVQVIDGSGKQVYKRPDDVDLMADEIVLSNDGSPIVMRGKPGRKPKSQLVPVSPQVAEVSKARGEHIDHDLLRREAEKDAEGDGVINRLILAMAEEAAAIEFEREEAGRHGQDTTNHSAKRARILKGMADTWLKRKQTMEGGIVDLDSPAFQGLFSFILETFKEAMTEVGSRPEFVETVFTKLVVVLADDPWKQEAKARMRDKLR